MFRLVDHPRVGLVAGLIVGGIGLVAAPHVWQAAELLWAVAAVIVVASGLPRLLSRLGLEVQAPIKRRRTPPANLGRDRAQASATKPPALATPAPVDTTRLVAGPVHAEEQFPPAPRVFIAALPADLARDLNTLTAVQFRKHFETELRGKWLTISGQVRDVTDDSIKFVFNQFTDTGIPTGSVLQLDVSLFFGTEHAARLALTHLSTVVTAQGCISGARRISERWFELRLERCEFVRP